MRGAVIYAPRDVRFEERDDPTIINPTDAVIRMSATCVCGSDLWDYRGINAVSQPTLMGHEYCGIVEEVGSQLTTIKPGQFRRRVLLRLRQHLRDLPGRLPDQLSAQGVRRR
jgi:threonine dehydrogenase-like Zn-dependent dehydrogenase